jgi:hypothetical protein
LYNNNVFDEFATNIVTDEHLGIYSYDSNNVYNNATNERMVVMIDHVVNNGNIDELINQLRNMVRRPFTDVRDAQPFNTFFSTNEGILQIENTTNQM